MISANEIAKIQQSNEQKIKEWHEKNSLPILEKLILNAVKKGYTEFKIYSDEMPWSEKCYGGTSNKNYCGEPIPKEFINGSQFINGFRKCLNSYGYSVERQVGGLITYIIRW